MRGCLLEIAGSGHNGSQMETAIVSIFQYPHNLGTPVVPFCPFYLGVSLLKPNSRKKGTLIIKGSLGNLVRI